jgi:hypothetical protein
MNSRELVVGTKPLNYYAVGIFGSEKDARRIAMSSWGVRLYGVEPLPLGSLGADGQAHFVGARTSIRCAEKLARWYAHSSARIKEIDAAAGPEAIAHHNSLTPVQKLPVELARLDANRPTYAGLLAFYKPVIENPVLIFAQLYWRTATLLALGMASLALLLF